MDGNGADQDSVPVLFAFFAPFDQICPICLPQHTIQGPTPCSPTTATSSSSNPTSSAITYLGQQLGRGSAPLLAGHALFESGSINRDIVVPGMVLLVSARPTRSSR